MKASRLLRLSVHLIPSFLDRRSQRPERIAPVPNLPRALFPGPEGRVSTIVLAILPDRIQEETAIGLHPVAEGFPVAR